MSRIANIWLSQFSIGVMPVDNSGSPLPQSNSRGRGFFLREDDREMIFRFSKLVPKAFNRYWKIDEDANLVGSINYDMDKDYGLIIASINPIPTEIVKDREIVKKETTVFFHHDDEHVPLTIQTDKHGHIEAILFTLPEESQIPKTFEQIKRFRAEYYQVHSTVVNEVSFNENTAQILASILKTLHV